MHNVTLVFGGLLIISAVGAGIAQLFTGSDSVFETTPLVFMFLLQVSVASFLIFASIQKEKNSAVSHKLYPSSIGAVILYLLIFYRWFWYG
jgi:hypothetical protein